MLTKVFIDLINLSYSASYLIIAIVIFRSIFRKVPKKYICILWLFAGVRLLVPVSIETSVGVIPNTQIVEEHNLIEDENPKINTQIEVVDTNINNYLEKNMTTPKVNSVNRMQLVIEATSFIWITGVIVLFVYLIISWIRIKVKVSEAVPFIIEENKYYVTDKISSPFLFGLINPRIYVPKSTQTALDDKQIELIIRHENAHKRRKDYLIKPIAYLLLTVYWINPLMWLAYILLCKDIELACDERVVKTFGEDIKADYSTTLLMCAVNRRTIAACPIAFGEVGVKNRVKNILNYKKPTVWIIAVAVIACIIVPVCFATQRKPESTQDNEKEINVNNIEIVENEVIESIDTESIVTHSSEDVKNIAIFGVDSRDGNTRNSRSDTIIIASINNKTEEVKLVSVLRDTYLNVGNEKYAKANTAYAYGGPDQAIEMLNNNLNLNISDYITVGFKGFENIIDAVGGIEIDVKEEEIAHLNSYQISIAGRPDGTFNIKGEQNYVAVEYEDYTPVVNAGLQNLNGLQALAYSRIRYVGNDFERTNKQRTVLTKVFEKAKTFNLDTLKNIMTGTLPYVSTSLDVSDIVDLMVNQNGYSVTGNCQFPFDEKYTVANVPNAGTCLVPDSLEDNVSLLHEFLNDDSSYVVSNIEKQIVKQ